MAKQRANYIPWLPEAKPDDKYPYAYNLILVNNIEELKQILTFQTDLISFDTETTGLNAEKDELVGYSFCMDGKNAYYVPVKHSTGGLGEESLDLIYNKMANTKSVAMFNMRFDVRMMEYYNYVNTIKMIDSTVPESQREEYYNRLLKVPFYKYDMSKCNIIDVQAIVYLVDTNVKYPSLKGSEAYYLGWRGASFEETIGDVENFFYLTPEEAYQYAATDALGTYLLLIKLQNYLKEAQTSGILDVQCLMPLTRFENETTLIDTEMLRSYSKYYDEEIKSVEERVRNVAGSPDRYDKKGNIIPWNLGSNKDKNEMLKRLNIYTGVKTKSGADSTSSDAIDVAISHLKPDDPNRKFLMDLQSYGTLSKQRNSYVDNTLEMCDNPLHRDRLRFSYKTTEVPSGRLAAGGDKKNQFFAGLNIQNIPKPKVKNWFTEKEELAYQRFPELKDALDRSGTLEECDIEVLNSKGEFELRHFYRILGWVFSDGPFEIEGQQEKVCEGFDQRLNVRSTFLPDPGTYWVSIDFNAEEIRIPALWSKEPTWVNAFKNGEDIHKATAVAIWGAENYDKSKRKKAKSANFGILYGMTARNFAADFKMSLEEGEKFVQDFKNGLPILFQWVSIKEKEAKMRGTISTYFGRPRRVKYWLESDEFGLRNFGLRTVINTIIQGTGADILKLVLINLFKTFYKDKKYTDIIRFKNTIHDEINYQIKKEYIRPFVKEVMKIMRIKLPNWEFPMEVGLSLGNRWGQSVDFNFDPNTLEIIEPKWDPYYPPEENTVEEVQEEPEEVKFLTWEEGAY